MYTYIHTYTNTHTHTHTHTRQLLMLGTLFSIGGACLLYVHTHVHTLDPRDDVILVAGDGEHLKDKSVHSIARLNMLQQHTSKCIVMVSKDRERDVSVHTPVSIALPSGHTWESATHHDMVVHDPDMLAVVSTPVAAQEV